jgi:phosphatidate cytidylyltransferase
MAIRASELLQRVVVGAILIVLAVGDIWLGGVWFWMLATAVALLMLSEFAPLVGASDAQRRYVLYAMCVPMGLVSPLALGLGFTAAGSLGGIALAILITTRNAALAGGIFYVGIPVFCLLWLRDVPGNGLLFALWALAVVWATDIGAYFAGRAIGGPKIAPAISPSKTWAGLGGGVLLAMILSWVLNHFAGLPATLALVSGLLAVAAQAGDFFESWLKRRAGVKDSGTLLPGHGGVLDRLDGVVTAIPLAALFVQATTA